MNKMKEQIQPSPLYPLKGKLTLNNLQTKLATNTPFRGQGVKQNKIQNLFYMISTVHMLPSPLFPLKGREALNNHQTELAANTPLRGLGVKEPAIIESFI